MLKLHNLSINLKKIKFNYENIIIQLMMILILQNLTIYFIINLYLQVLKILKRIIQINICSLGN